KTPPVAIHFVKAAFIRHIQRPQNKRIQYAEDHGVCANAQCQRDDGNSSKTTRLPQHADRKAYISGKGIYRGNTSRIATLFRRPIDAAEFPTPFPLGFR